MNIRAESMEDGDIAVLTKLKITGDEADLREFAFSILDAIEHGKAKRRVNSAKVVIKCTST